jgi:hypothetical protein
MDNLAAKYHLPAFSKLVSMASPGAFTRVTSSQPKETVSLESLCLIPLPPFLIPCIASHAHSNFAELGKACVDEIMACTSLVCDKGGQMKENPHCQRIAQFMWWASQRGNRTVEYRLGMTLLVDPKPSIIKWRGAEIAEAIGSTEKTSAAKPGTSDGSANLSFSGALVDALGSLKTTMDSINLKEALSAREGSKHFAHLPEHLKILMYRISYVPGAAEPTLLTTECRNTPCQTPRPC